MFKNVWFLTTKSDFSTTFFWFLQFWVGNPALNGKKLSQNVFRSNIWLRSGVHIYQSTQRTCQLLHLFFYWQEKYFYSPEFYWSVKFMPNRNEYVSFISNTNNVRNERLVRMWTNLLFAYLNFSRKINFWNFPFSVHIRKY